MDLTAISEKLYQEAEDVRKNAYAPFSNFQVGAALAVSQEDDSDIRIYTGVNIENSSYGATICAERSAFACAISDGAKKGQFLAIAISAGDVESVPCGICRQFMLEFAPHITIITKSKGQLILRTLDELLPNGFVLDPKEMDEDAANHNH